MDGRWKLAAFVLAAAGLATLQTVGAAAVGLAAVIALAVAAHVSRGWYVRRLVPLAWFLVLVSVLLPLMSQDGGPSTRIGPLRVSWHGTRMALLLVLKAVAVVTLMVVLFASTTLPGLLHAAAALRVPALLVHLGLLTYRYVFLWAAELGRIRTALRVRGFRNRGDWHSHRTVGRVAGMLLVRSHERSERVGRAMRCRGFTGRFRSLASFRTTATDVVLFALLVGGAGGLWAWDVLQR